MPNGQAQRYMCRFSDEGQTGEELAAGADAYYTDRFRIVSIEANNLVRAHRRGYGKGAFPTTLARGYHQSSRDKP
jgi:hypothetical protein